MSSFENELSDWSDRKNLQNQLLETQRLEALARQEAERERQRQRPWTATPVHEALGADAPLALEFIAFMKRHRFNGAVSPRILTGTSQESPSLFSAILNKPAKTVDVTSPIRGYPIGRRGPSSSDQHWSKDDVSIILCEDGALREGGDFYFRTVGQLHVPYSTSAGNLAKPAFDIGLYDHMVDVERPTSNDIHLTVKVEAFHQLTLKETLLTIADNVL